MNALEAALRAIAAALDRADRSWALVGGLAVSVHAEPRTTRDADVAVAVKDDADAEALVFKLGGEGFSLLSTVEQRATGRLSGDATSTLSRLLPARGLPIAPLLRPPHPLGGLHVDGAVLVQDAM